MSLNIKTLPFNPIEANCYVVSDSSKACVIIDPSCESKAEADYLFQFIEENELKPKHVIITHAHIDHYIGSVMVCEKYNLPLTLHEEAKEMFLDAPNHAKLLRMHLERIPENLIFVKQGDVIRFGISDLEVRYTPGHADGSMCLISHADKTVFTGDVLFRNSIGRSDLMTGDFDKLRDSIFGQLFTLPEDYTVRPGHGGRTTIGYEKENNPFLIN